MQRAWIRIFLVVAAVSLFPSCGGGGGQASGAKPAVALGTQNFNVPAGDGTALSIDVPSPGALAATANWAEVGAEIDVYLTASSCASLDDLVLGSCAVLGRGDAQGTRLQTATALGLQPGRYQAFVLGVGQMGASGTVTFTLSP